MDVLKTIPYLILVLGVATLIAGAVALSLSKFADTTTDTDALAVIGNGSAAIITIAEQLSTIAIIGIMAVIIGLLSTVFVYMAYFRQ